MRDARIERADGQHFGANHAPLRVQHDDAHALLAMGSIDRHQVLGDLARTEKARALTDIASDGPASELDSCQDPGCPRAADAGNLAQIARSGAREATNSAGPLE